MGLENVVFNDFIDDELDSKDLSEQRASASLPDSVPTETEEDRAAREADEMAALDAVGDYEARLSSMIITSYTSSSDFPPPPRHAPTPASCTPHTGAKLSLRATQDSNDHLSRCPSRRFQADL